MKSVVDTLKLPESQLETLLSDLERATREPFANSQRGSRRWSMSLQRVVVTFQSERGEHHHVCVPRNISTDGAAVLHGGFVYVSTPCRIAMRDLKGRAVSLPGRVVRCRLVRGTMHDIGIEFDSRINPREFIDFGAEVPFNIERVEKDRLVGRLLVIEDNRADQKLIAHHFKDTKLEIQYASDAANGLTMLREQPDLVLCDMDLPEKSGLDVTREARSAGFPGPIVLMATSKDRELRAEAIEAGANEVIRKPFKGELLLRAAAEFLMGLETENPERGRIVPKLENSELTSELVCDYVDDLRRKCDEIAELLDKGDSEAIVRIIDQIRGSGSSYGLEPLSIVAEQAAHSIESSESLESAMSEIQRLIGACRRVLPPTRDSGGGA